MNNQTLREIRNWIITIGFILVIVIFIGVAIITDLAPTIAYLKYIFS